MILEEIMFLFRVTSFLSYHGGYLFALLFMLAALLLILEVRWAFVLTPRGDSSGLVFPNSANQWILIFRTLDILNTVVLYVMDLQKL